MKYVQELQGQWKSRISAGDLSGSFLDSLRGDIRWRVELKEDGQPGFQIDGESVGESNPPSIRARELGQGYQIIYSRIRQHRPGFKKPVRGRQPDLPQEVSLCQFGCQDPTRRLSLLAHEPLAQFSGPFGKYGLYPNAAPLNPKGHIIWVKVFWCGAYVVIPHLAQRFTEQMLGDFCAAAGAMTDSILFFNSPHAGASAYHLHFQSVVHDSVLAIESAGRTQLGRLTILCDYPATGLVFSPESSGDLWQCIDRFQNSGVPFNLVAVSSHIYLFPRNLDHEVVEELPDGVLASMELIGQFYTGDLDVFEEVSGELLSRALSKVTLSPPELIPLLIGIA